MRGRYLLLTACASCLVMMLNAYATQAPEKEKLAQKAAESWLNLVDDDKYEASWTEASPAFKNLVPKERWVVSLDALRKSLGKLKTRKLKLIKFTTKLSGSPPGSYFVIQYESGFENDAAAVIETVVPMLDEDGKWRVSGYHINKAAPSP